MQKNINILITGGAGYVGSHLIKFLIDKPFIKIIAIDNFSNSKSSLIDDLKKKSRKNFLFKKIDIRNNKKLSELFHNNSVDVVIHLASKIDAAESFKKKSEYKSVNLVSSKMLIDIAVANKVDKFIFASSAAVYGEVSKGYCSEKKITKPINPYGEYKLKTENYIIENKKKINFVILRFFNIAGINKYFYKYFEKRSSIFFSLFKFLINKKKIFYVNKSHYYSSDSSPVRDYIHIDDICKIIYNSIYLKKPKIIINCGTGLKVSVIKFVKTLQHIIKFKINTEFRLPRIGDPTCVVSDTKLIKKTFKNLKYRNLHSILKDCYNMSLFFKK
tara:strand:+ start:5235 stop:6224 length:990 start_codon:yes stop_codon:yes gene_type:complete